MQRRRLRQTDATGSKFKSYVRKQQVAVSEQMDSEDESADRSRRGRRRRDFRRSSNGSQDDSNNNGHWPRRHWRRLVPCNKCVAGNSSGEKSCLQSDSKNEAIRLTLVQANDSCKQQQQMTIARPESCRSTGSVVDTVRPERFVGHNKCCRRFMEAENEPTSKRSLLPKVSATDMSDRAVKSEISSLSCMICCHKQLIDTLTDDYDEKNNERVSSRERRQQQQQRREKANEDANNDENDKYQLAADLLTPIRFLLPSARQYISYYSAKNNNTHDKCLLNEFRSHQLVEEEEQQVVDHCCNGPRFLPLQSTKTTTSMDTDLPDRKSLIINNNNNDIGAPHSSTESSLRREQQPQPHHRCCANCFNSVATKTKLERPFCVPQLRQEHYNKAHRFSSTQVRPKSTTTTTTKSRQLKPEPIIKNRTQLTTQTSTTRTQTQTQTTTTTTTRTSCRTKSTKTNALQQKNSKGRLLMSCVLVVYLVLLAFFSLGQNFRIGKPTTLFASAYQLTNNIIANNLPPKFVNSNGNGGSQQEIVVRVKEGPQSIGKLIYTLKGEDPDEDPLTFGVLGSLASELLRIDNVPGNQAHVYLRKELDRETTESHQIVITLTDGKLGRGNWITKSMLIIVEDINDNYPVFGPHRTAISVREDSKAPLVLETLEASDADEGRFGQVIYRLDLVDSGNSNSNNNADTNSQQSQQQQQRSNPFAIETIDGKGVISLIGSLDYEQRPLYQLRILAIDRAVEHERLSTSTSILISVEDCEDQAPLFTFAPSITRVPENLPVGSPLVRVAAIDGDRGVNNPIEYKLVAVNGRSNEDDSDNLFAIEAQTGQISVAHELDRESGGSLSSSRSNQHRNQQAGTFVLQVKASEISETSAGSSVTTELTIVLEDVNDEAPTFNRQHFYGELLENSAPETLVTFVASATGSPPPPPIGQQTAAPPVEDQQSSMTNVIAAKVFDRDLGSNATFTLHLEGEHAHLFDIWPHEATNEASLMIKVSSQQVQQLTKFLDFERFRQFNFKIVAKEKYTVEQRTSSAQMSVILRDANDNYPQFESELYRVEIPENAVRGMHVCVVKATDIDSGQFGTIGIRYTEIRGERANKFKLDPLTGVITLKTNEHGFDRETIGQHHLIVEARDSNGVGNRNTTQLLIVLTDANDQRPKFLLDQYEAFIYENELDFQSPLQVQAIDNDAPNTPNSRVTYSISGGDPQQNFTIDPLTGRIRVRSSLILADFPSQHLAGARSITNPSGSESDLAESSSHPQDRQQHSPTTMTIITGGLDFERIPQRRDETRMFNLTIKATDSGLPEPLSDTTQVIVLVYDKNDHAPVFSKQVYSKTLREDAKEGTQVVQVNAHDDDHSPTNSKITYRISSGASDKFVIDSETGLITVASGANLDIDRAGGHKIHNYLLNVLAFDGSFGPNQKSTSALVNISIIDVNNKAPEFITLGAILNPSGSSTSSTAHLTPRNSNNFGTGATQPILASTQQQQQQQQQVVYVSEDAPYGLIVTRVVAIDLDTSAELRYSINWARSEARNDDMSPIDPALYRDVFAIEPTDGTIKVTKQLDRELFDQLKLRLQVEDIAAQTPDQIAFTYLLVKVTDINDNRPSFKRPIYRAVVNENSISGTSVITVAADDKDLNQTLRYSLEAPMSPELLRLIRINPRTGEVTVNDKIDRELHPMINVTIKAEDFGQPQSLTGSAYLQITVRDENDNNPIFVNSTNSTPQHSPASSSANGPRNHNMASTNNTYRLRSLGLPPTGAAAADQAGSVAYQLDYPEASAQSPVYSKLPLMAPGSSQMVREDALVGYQVAYVRAEDADTGNNGRVTYLMDAISSGGKFRIDRDTGVISVAAQLDRETQRQFGLIIEACDNYDLGYATGESRRAFTQVNIVITDINDNVPIISTNLQTSNSQPNGDQSSNNLPAPSGGIATYPTYDEAMRSPGPHELPLAECLFINEFQALNEPILTVTASDADDFETPNGQVDLAIINNLPQNELFSLIPVTKPIGSQTSSAKPTVAASSTTNVAPPVEVDTSETTSESSEPPLTLNPAEMNGFEDLVVGESAKSARKTINLKGMRPKRSIPTTSSLFEPLEMAANNFYASPAERSRATFRSLTGRSADTTTTMSTTTSTTTTRAPSYHNYRAQLGFVAPTGSDAVASQAYVVVAQTLKERVGNYTIMVRATDRGQPALSSVRLINICVQDVNNHAPVFSRPPLNHTLRIMENATIGTFVTQAEATDLDHGLNGELQYSLKPTNIQNGNNDWQSFKIDRLTGVITTAKTFNRQVKRYYTLRVQAQDFGRPTMLSSDIDINIMIVNSGKYQPEFESQMQQLQFTENVAPGVEWFTLLQTTNLEDDPALINIDNNGPIGDNGQPITGYNSQPDKPSAAGVQQRNNWLASPCYYIVDGDDYEQVFHLDRYTHRLTNQRSLDRERQANYTLLIQASNNCIQRPSPPVYPPTPIALDSGGAKQNGSPEPPLTSYRSARALVNRTTNIMGRSEKLVKLNSIPEDTDDPKASALVLPARLNIAALDALIAADKSFLKVLIRVKDLNDNAPRFTQRIYTGGLTTEADFGTVFMIVQAIDPDAEANSQVTYSIVKPIKKYLTHTELQSRLQQEGRVARSNRTSETSNKFTTRQKRAALYPTTTIKPSDTSLATTTTPPKIQETTSLDEGINDPLNEIPFGDNDDLFVIHPQTGEISLNFDPQKHMKGYFEFEITANDTGGLSDQSRVYIYLLRQDQRVKFVLRLTPQELRQQLNKFRSVMGNITGAIVNIDSYKYYENHDGTVDKKKTSLYLHFVNPDDNTIIEVNKVLTLIDNNIEYLDELYKEFHVLSSEAAQLPLSSSALVDPIDQIRTGLMGISSFLALILVLVIALCLNQRTRYERQLKAATVSAFGSSPLHLNPDFHSQTNLPNTNLHSQDPNPIWVSNGYGGTCEPVDWLGGLSSSSATGGNIGAVNKGTSRAATGRATGSCGSQADGLKRSKNTNHTASTARKSLASSGVGLAIDDEDDDDEMLNHHRRNNDDDDDDDEMLSSTNVSRTDCDDLSSFVGATNGNINGLNGELNGITQLHYNVATTATPRSDSLNSSQGQGPSSTASGSGGSASTTNDRQALCGGGGVDGRGRRTPAQKAVGGGSGGTISRQKHPASNSNASKQRRNIEQVIGGANGTNGTHTSTFGALKEVTIYTASTNDQHRSVQQQQQQPVQHNQTQESQSNFQWRNGNRAQSPTKKQPTNNINNLVRTVNGQQQQQQKISQQVTSQVSKIASQFNAAKQQQQQQQCQKGGSNQTIFINNGNNTGQISVPQAPQPSLLLLNNAKQQSINQFQAPKPIPKQQQRIVVHANGADVNQGIIKTQQNNAVSLSNGGNKPTMLSHAGNANSVTCAINQQQRPSNAAVGFNPTIIQQQQQQQQSVSALQTNRNGPAKSFETSLSKLSILNLETTEL